MLFFRLTEVASRKPFIAAIAGYALSPFIGVFCGMKIRASIGITSKLQMGDSNMPPTITQASGC